ncbi:hypothetical protein BDN71DRAFT_1433593 [Pleurotus eryngii]|uniref:Uncharacterized protein n=1 Tax=Pleurotus eryngii TaxID=5323 RepID=A0A9P5ZR57_PLEER|nr:hypothetical protein BDN71DRAFT_1433593 [Pleurotus eryngii]
MRMLFTYYDTPLDSITWTTPGSDDVQYLVLTNIPDLATSKVEVDEAPTNFTLANCGTQNFVKEKKQYYAITSGAQVGVVKGVLMDSDTATVLIHGVSGGVCLGFCLEALAIEHFQKGVSSRMVIVRKPVASPM